MEQNRPQPGQQDNPDNPNQTPEQPTPIPNREPAEGSRETVRDEEREQGGGISNRPADREQQEEVPPPGETTDEDRNA